MQNYVESLDFYAAYASGQMKTVGYQSTTGSLSENDRNAVQLEAGKHAGQYMNTILAAHLFEIEPNLAFLLENTNNQVRPDVRLPFPVCFFDVRLGGGDKQYFGLLMYEAYVNPEKTMGGMRALNVPLSPEEAARFEASGRERKIFIQTVFKKGSSPARMELKINLHDAYKQYPHIVMGEDDDPAEFEDESDFVRRVSMNILDFIHDPEVKQVLTQRSEKNLKRHADKHRVNRGNMPTLYTRILITGELKRYVQTARLGNQPGRYSHKFYVRGHFRRLTSERFKEARGKVLWIPPYVKGEGMLVRKSYGVEA